MAAKDVRVDLPPCAAWKTSGITIAGHEDGTPGDALDALKGPIGLYAAESDSLYVADRNNHRIMRYNSSTGRIGTPIGRGLGTDNDQFDEPTSVLMDPTTNMLYISDARNNRIQQWNEGGMGNSVKTVAGQPGKVGSGINALALAYDIQLDPHSNDTLFITDTLNDRVMKWHFGAPSGEIMASKLSRPLGIHVHAQGSVFIAECGTSQISKWPQGMRVAGVGRPGSNIDSLNCPYAIVVDLDGSMFIADTFNNRIMRWQSYAPHGICLVGCTTTSGKRPDQLTTPSDVTFDQKGNLLVADTGNNRVQRFDIFIDPLCGK